MPPAKGCYCCRDAEAARHRVYPLLCEDCGAENLARRESRTDLSGVVALVTGARIKIGYHTALRLLRRGARVVATTRFPLSAIESFEAEPDASRWRDRLLVRGLDLVRVDLLGDFVERLRDEVGHLDLLVNNAAQTVVDPVGLWGQWEHETGLGRSLATGPGVVPASLTGLVPEAPALPGPSVPPVDMAHGPVAPTTGSAPLAPGPTGGVVAGDDWVKRSADVSLTDLLTVQIVNVTAPYLLAVGLRDLLVSSPHRHRFVVNVSSLEGKFSVRRKSPAHPHTNMAKAALNMMTKTLAGEYRKDRILTYSIDPGWVSHQFPPGRRTPPGPLPLTFADAAARITQPLDDWRDADRPPTGVFLKDYRETDW